ncbi:MAG: hypothetical protein ACRD06_00920, partial [Terriglobia bacterium]
GYTDQQLVQIVFGPGFAALYFNNAGASQVKGLETETNWQMTKSLRLYSILAFNGGKYTKPLFCSNQLGARINCTDKHLKGLPAVDSTLGLRFSPEISVLPGQLLFNVEWDHTSEMYNDTANPLPPPLNFGPTPLLNLYNASVRWTGPKAEWYALLQVTNLTNKHYVQAGYTNSNPINPGVVGYLGEPRVEWFRIGYSF